MELSQAVLVVSYQPDAFSAHVEALTASGYRVSSAANLSAALGAVGPGGFDLLVLASNIPAGDRRRIEAEAKRRHRAIRIVLFYHGERERDVFAAAFLEDSSPTDLLVRTASELLSAPPAQG